jgi:hypothetical protein
VPQETIERPSNGFLRLDGRAAIVTGGARA